MPLLDCALMGHTGAIIRFRPSQLPTLPAKRMHVSVELPNGTVVDGDFNPHHANPYISGAAVRQFILQKVGAGSSRKALIDVSGRHWHLFDLEEVEAVASEFHAHSNRLAKGELAPRDVQQMLNRLDALSGSTERQEGYSRLLRPAGLRRFVLTIFGEDCQIQGCDVARDWRRDWQDAAAGAAILDVHHIEALAQVVDHHPRNLCVVCANHHRLIHGLSPWSVRHESDDVLLGHGSRSLRILRNLASLR